MRQIKIKHRFYHVESQDVINPYMWHGLQPCCSRIEAELWIARKRHGHHMQYRRWRVRGPHCVYPVVGDDVLWMRGRAGLKSHEQNDD